ncbi:hypothetical protein L5515_014148 [Caenorhabditis briggsae]|uniref:Uncharacterized protein n=1 Tax=Caenorhabditis briggsae TaxID=6238 RepID=A0AAE9E8D6_CAEBR|nr:hypothetical protein L5515_014148 [Caenorhabditis briggsae]
MDSDSIPELSYIVCRNLHFFIPAFSLFIIEIGISSYQIQYQEALTLNYSTLILILLLVSMPLSVFNPPVWFTLYMTTFIHMLYFKGLYMFSLGATMMMFMSIFYHEATRIRTKTKGSNNQTNGPKLKTS